MPFFRGPDFAVLLWRTLLREFRCLESDLSSNAEVSHYIENDLLQHGVLWQLLKDIWLRIQFICIHWSKVHDVAYIKVVDPIVIVFDTKRISDIDFEFVNSFQLLDLIIWIKCWLLLILRYCIRICTLWCKLQSCFLKLIKKRLCL